MPYSVRVLIFTVSVQPDPDVIALDKGLIGSHRAHRRQCQDAAGEQVEAAAMPGALDRRIVELALAQRAAIVRADIVDGPPFAILRQTDAQRATVELHDPHRAGRHVTDMRDRHETACGLLESAHELSSLPMRDASAARMRSRIVSSSILATTCSKKPRTIIRSAESESSPRVWA